MKLEKVSIRETTADDLGEIMQVERLAFGQEEEANLVSDLLSDSTAKPTLSLLAFYDRKSVGHILFSRVYFVDSAKQPLMYILAPLAVTPEYQGFGIGGKLITQGLEILKKWGTEKVFVLGHEKYYPKFGFIPNAEKFGLKAPYPIPKEHANAWMFQTLAKEKQAGLKGKIKCADELNKSKYWQE